MNGYLRPEGFNPAGPTPGFVTKFYDLPETHRTIVMFEAGFGVEATKDHVESPDWFDVYNLKRNTPPQHAVWDAVKSRSRRRSPSGRNGELPVRGRTRGRDRSGPDRRVVRCGS